MFNSGLIQIFELKSKKIQKLMYMFRYNKMFRTTIWRYYRKRYNPGSFERRLSDLRKKVTKGSIRGTYTKTYSHNHGRQ